VVDTVYDIGIISIKASQEDLVESGEQVIFSTVLVGAVFVGLLVVVGLGVVGEEDFGGEGGGDQLSARH